MKMNTHKHKAMSVLFTTFIIFTLILMGPANAITINIDEPNDANQGGDVEFQVTVDLESPDQYLPIQYTTLIFTEPNGNEFTCTVFNDGTTSCPNVDVIINIQSTYGQGHQLGYGYGYGYGYDYTYFGYGYGYGYAGENGQITYDVTLHLDGDAQTGDYQVKAETYVASEDSIQDSPYSYCGIMEGMYNEYIYLNGLNGSYYDEDLDLYFDGVIDLSDVVVFGQNYTEEEDSVLFGRFQEFIRFTNDNGSINPSLDTYPEPNGDGIISLSDIIIYAGNMNDEAWCADRLGNLDEGVERLYTSNEQTFTVSSVPVDNPEPNNGGGSSSRGGSLLTCEEEGYEMVDGECVYMPRNGSREEQPVVTEESDNEENNNLETSGNGGFFNAITGAVTGAGGAIGLGETMSYLFALFLLGIIIIGLTRKFRKSGQQSF
jgi:hypothetical protein